uniref:Secreted protein n=1 Tax=Romanomermis culicivorax TaxID=13658 RepID=A0A915HTN2_ROMCU
MVCHTWLGVYLWATTLSQTAPCGVRPLHLNFEEPVTPASKKSSDCPRPHGFIKCMIKGGVGSSRALRA